MIIASFVTNIRQKYDQYNVILPSANTAAVPSSQAPAAPVIQDRPQVVAGVEKGAEEAVTPLPAAQGSIISREEKIEYRDENGNILDPEQVKELEGKVSFKTRYETRTRIIDSAGNEIGEQVVEGVAPPHPDVEGSNPETIDKPQDEANEQPPTVEVADDKAKESEIVNKKGKRAGNKQAQPASDANEATK